MNVPEECTASCTLSDRITSPMHNSKLQSLYSRFQPLTPPLQNLLPDCTTTYLLGTQIAGHQQKIQIADGDDTRGYDTDVQQQQALVLPAALAPSPTSHLRLKVDLSLATVLSSTFWEPLNAAA